MKLTTNVAKKSLPFLLSIAVVLAVFFNLSVAPQKALAATSALSGWAWGDNLGWISFSNTTDGTVHAYGVTMNNGTGALAGYAWSDNIGWIDFNAADVVGCPSGTCPPTVTIIGGAVTGWAKILSTGGWLQLSGANHVSPDATGNSGVTYTLATGTFNGYAWGNDADYIGWVNFGAVVGITGSGVKIGAAPTQALTVTVNGPSGTGGVTGGSISCATNGGSGIGTCANTYTTGSVVVLTEAPAGSGTFSGWSGACSGIATTCSITMTTGESVAATFAAADTPSAPHILGPSTGVINTLYTYNASSTDPLAHHLLYNIIINTGATPLPTDNGTYKPATATDTSGVNQPFTKTWATQGTQTIWVQAINTGGTRSAWSSYTVNISPSGGTFKQF